MVLIIWRTNSGNNHAANEVSVPLRGLWFLSIFYGKQEKSNHRLFPSPCGDYGSYLRRYTTTKKPKSRFRPLAGIMVLIINLAKNVYISASLGFRPLAGIMVLIRSRGHIMALLDLLGFPSPCGDYGSYRVLKHYLP